MPDPGCIGLDSPWNKPVPATTGLESGRIMPDSGRSKVGPSRRKPRNADLRTNPHLLPRHRKFNVRTCRRFFWPSGRARLYKRAVLGGTCDWVFVSPDLGAQSQLLLFFFCDDSSPLSGSRRYPLPHRGNSRCQGNIPQPKQYAALRAKARAATLRMNP